MHRALEWAVRVRPRPRDGVHALGFDRLDLECRFEKLAQLAFIKERMSNAHLVAGHLSVGSFGDARAAAEAGVCAIAERCKKRRVEWEDGRNRAERRRDLGDRPV